MPAFPLLQRAWNRLRASVAPVPDISAALWLNTLGQYPFLAALTLPEQAKLRALAALFLQRKEFTGAHGLEVTDAMAVAIAAQACLPLLHLGAPRDALAWYDDFVGIVVHPGDALARRTTTDEAGVVHHYHEVLLGEAMERGPVMLSWQAVQDAAHHSQRGASTALARRRRPSTNRASYAASSRRSGEAQNSTASTRGGNAAKPSPVTGQWTGSLSALAAW